ncbi:hypothetical protein CLF_100425 [Clonorchis sinensis]|uniref:Uncharacterized protein n=1 Tax=Clonorchis sinensis TaxID=79923 RepID=G7Y3F1_CLOSI|nr:hypothetical protein CLF_100425 [Clonorchis sinensis]
MRAHYCVETNDESDKEDRRGRIRVFVHLVGENVREPGYGHMRSSCLLNMRNMKAEGITTYRLPNLAGIGPRLSVLTVSQTTKSNLMSRRPSRGVISRVALLAAYSRVGQVSRTDDSARLASTLQATSVSLPALISSGISKSIFKPRRQICLAASNVRILKQVGKQAARALTMDSLDINLWCVSETRIQDVSTVVELATLSFSTPLWLRTSGGPEAAAVGCARVGIVHFHRGECIRLQCGL